MHGMFFELFARRSPQYAEGGQLAWTNRSVFSKRSANSAMVTTARKTKVFAGDDFHSARYNDAPQEI